MNLSEPVSTGEERVAPIAAARDLEQRIVDNLPLVYGVALRVHRDIRQAVDLDELVSIGTEGLLQAARRFRADRGASFRTYAYYRIRGAIYDGLGRLGPLPRTAYRRQRALHAMHSYLVDHDALAGTDTDDAGVIDDALRGLAAVFVTTLDAADDELEQLADEDADLERRMAAAGLRRSVERALARLPAEQRHLIRRHYYDGASLLEAGEELGISKSWASRLHARAIRGLRDALAEYR